MNLPRGVVAIGVWTLLALGAIFFATRTPQVAAMRGTLLRLIIYGVYELTNYALLEWPFKVVLVDIAWGTALCAIAAGTSVYFS